MTASTSNPCLLRDDFIDSRNTQDRQLDAELASIRAYIQACVDATEKNLIRRINDSDAKNKQKMAYIRNQKLRNPKLPIAPVVSLRDGGLVQHEPTRFPEHANQFYALRRPDTTAKVHDETYTDEGEEDAATADKPSKLSLWDAVQTCPELAVDELESVLGLNKQNFIVPETARN
ncbi:wac domain-containing protein [Colletotrichum incanum]|uniref:Wac domain-containing protein n=1 Tax=Colletotrichum incanum TaxID=1573173 RepID=A0A162NB88_COLIC|nr:wac domain-containing protein [Colletotrichum incanum]